MRADDQWQMQAAGKNGAVRQRTTLRGDHRHHAAFGQLRQFGRRDGVGDQHIASQTDDVTARIAMQGGVHTADDMIEILTATAHVRVVDAVKHRSQTVALQTQGIVGAVVGLADQVVKPVQKLRVVENQSVQVEKLTQLMCQRALQALTHLHQFGPGDIKSQMQSFDFSIDRLRGNLLWRSVEYLALSDPRTSQRKPSGCSLCLHGASHQPPSSK